MAETQENTKQITRWQPTFLLDIYQLARAGLSEARICDALGIHRNTLALWRRKRPEVAEALERARKAAPEEDGFRKYFYALLPPRLRELWDRLMSNRQAGGGVAEIDAVLADHGARARQSLFLHALVHSHYNPHRAMELVGIDKRQLVTWMEDPDFAELIAQAQDHKGDYFEELLVRLAGEGHPGAIMMVNKTFNRKRGYGQVTEMEISGQVAHTHSVIDLADLDLSPEVRLAVVEARRKKEQDQERQRLLGSRPREDRVAAAVDDLIRVQAASAPAQDDV